MKTEFKVKIKTSDQDYNRKFLLEESFLFGLDSAIIKDMVSQAINEFKLSETAASEGLDISIYARGTFQ